MATNAFAYNVNDNKPTHVWEQRQDRAVQQMDIVEDLLPGLENAISETMHHKAFNKDLKKMIYFLKKWEAKAAEDYEDTIAVLGEPEVPEIASGEWVSVGDIVDNGIISVMRQYGSSNLGSHEYDIEVDDVEVKIEWDNDVMNVSVRGYTTVTSDYHSTICGHHADWHPTNTKFWNQDGDNLVSDYIEEHSYWISGNANWDFNCDPTDDYEAGGEFIGEYQLVVN